MKREIYSSQKYITITGSFKNNRNTTSDQLITRLLISLLSAPSSIDHGVKPSPSDNNKTQRPADQLTLYTTARN